MKDSYEALSLCMNGVGLSYGIANFDDVYGIILIVVNVIQLVFALITEIRKLKNGETTSTDGLKDAIGSVADVVVDLVEEIRDGDDSNNGETNE